MCSDRWPRRGPRGAPFTSSTLRSIRAHLDHAAVDLGKMTGSRSPEKTINRLSCGEPARRQPYVLDRPALVGEGQVQRAVRCLYEHGIGQFLIAAIQRIVGQAGPGRVLD